MTYERFTFVALLTILIVVVFLMCFAPEIMT